MNQPQAVKSPLLKILGVLIFAHLIVDWIASTVVPIFPDLERQMALGEGGFIIGYIIWRVVDSGSQMVFGYLGDRFDTSRMIWLGPCIAVVAYSFLGFVSSPVVATIVLMIGGAGIAAFHPEAAVMAGSSMPNERNRAMALFALAGYIGQSIGPFYAGRLTAAHGNLKVLGWSTVWAIPALAIVAWGIRNRSKVHAQDSPDEHDAPRSKKRPSLREMLRGRERIMTQIVCSGALRIVPILGVPLAISYLLKAAGESNASIGDFQSAFMFGLGIGGMFCALFVGPKIERTILWFPPLLASIPVFAAGSVTGSTQLLIIGIAGALLGCTLPVFISYAQRMMPQGQRLASSLTMGFSWGVASIISGLAVKFLMASGNLDQIFWFFGICCILCSIVCIGLPNAADVESPSAPSGK